MPPEITSKRARLALDTILRKPTVGIPSWLIHVMDHAHIERIAGAGEGDYEKDPDGTYLSFQQKVGTCLLDQYIPRNPLTMGRLGFESAPKGPTTGGRDILRDGVRIDSPEAVVEHLERSVFPELRRAAQTFDEDARVQEIIEGERATQTTLGPLILKSGYGFVRFPGFAYGTYGYEHYFTAYALYPEVMGGHFSLQADVAVLNNRAAAKAYIEGDLPPLYRLDHDMADSRGTLVDVRSLDRIWFPHFARSLEPLLKADVRLIWHCDGNLMEMVPRLLEVGIRGSQGFQYEDGMDYEEICKLRGRGGEGLIIIAGVSVTRTLPFGSPDDVRREMAWLVEKGPEVGLFLACSSTIAPGVPWGNVRALIDGLKHYRDCGRS